MARHRCLGPLVVAVALQLSSCKGKENATVPPARTGAAASGSAALASAQPVVAWPPPFTALRAEDLIAKVRQSGKRATIINAWASWCGPCKREIPMLQTMAQNLEPEGVAFLLVSVEDLRDRALAEAFLRDNHITIRSYMAAGLLADFKRAMNPRWPGMLPATFLFDGEGKLRYFWGGPAYENEIVPIIESFLAGKQIDGETNFGLAPGQVTE